MAVYDPETPKKPKAVPADQLKDAEQSGATQSGTSNEAAESNQASASTDSTDNGGGGGGGFFRRGKGKSRIRGRIRGNLTRRQAIMGGGTGILIGVLFWAFSIFQGPLQVIHLAQLLQKFHFSNNEEFMDGRSTRLVRSLLAGGTIGAARQNTRLGKIAGRYVQRIDSRMLDRSGLRSMMDQTTGRFVGYEVADEQKARSYMQDFDADDVPILDETPDFVIGSDGLARAPRRPFIDLRNTAARTRRSAIKAVTRGADIEKIPGGLSSRLLMKRAGVDFHPLKNAQRRAEEKLVDFWRRQKEERSERRKQGTEGPDGRLDGKDVDSDSDGEADFNTDNAADAGNDFADEAADAATPEAKSGLVKKLLAGGGIVMALAQALCIIDDVSESIDVYRYENIILPMIRMGTEAITTGNQVMAAFGSGGDKADVNMAELGAYASDLTKILENGERQSWAAARSIQAENGREPNGPDVPPEARPSEIGEKGFLFDFVDNLGTVLDIGCGLSDSVLGSIPIVKDVVNLSESVVTGALNTALAPFGVSMESLFQSIVAFFAGDVVNTFAQGADFGNIVNYGARLAGIDVAISQGGRELSKEEEEKLSMYNGETLRLERERQNVFARMFNPMDADSFTAVAMREAPQSPKQAFAAFIGAPAKLVGTLFTPASAQEVAEYDYGFNEFGYSLEEQADARVDDSVANEEIVAPRLAELNSEYGDCFSMQIDVPTNGLIIGEAKRFDEIDDKCKDKNNEDLLRYRMFLADTIAGFTIACNEGDDSACQMLIYGVQQEGYPTEGSGSLGISPDGFTFPLRTTRNKISSHRPQWCHTSQENCHHDYNAADIFADTGTPVVAARGGTVVKATDNDGSSVGSRVTIQGDDGNLYYYAHMGDGTIRVSTGDTVTAGQALGNVGNSSDAVGTDPHLHFDALPNTTSRPSCSGAECTGYPFINVQPVLIEAFNALP